MIPQAETNVEVNGQTEFYDWLQNRTIITVEIRPEHWEAARLRERDSSVNLRGRDLHIKIEEGHLRVALRGKEDEALLDAPLLKRVKVADSTWTVCDGTIEITMEKDPFADNKEPYWSSLLVGDNTVDVDYLNERCKYGRREQANFESAFDQQLKPPSLWELQWSQYRQLSVEISIIIVVWLLLLWVVSGPLFGTPVLSMMLPAIFGSPSLEATESWRTLSFVFGLILLFRKVIAVTGLLAIVFGLQTVIIASSGSRALGLFIVMCVFALVVTALGTAKNALGRQAHHCALLIAQLCMGMSMTLLPVIGHLRNKLGGGKQSGKAKKE